MKIIEVAAAIIMDGNKIYATQRGYGDFEDGWEFPGGKIEKGETREAALIREIKEELNIDIAVKNYITTVEYDYPAFHLTMHCFVCEIINGEPMLLEHKAARWLPKEELGTVDWLPADVDLIKLLKNIL